jgi:heme A synthase
MLEHRFAVVLAVLTFCLLLLGGVVHNTGSSLACPDWPLCYGSLMPEMKGGVAIEHSHRLLAAAVGLMTIVLAFLLWKRRGEDRGLVKMGVAAVFLVVFQGVLGGITVLYQLPDAVSTAHLAVSMIYFSLVIVIAWRTSLTPRPPLPQGARGWIKTAALLVYFQIVLGALVRHTGSGLACPDVPFCYGLLWPVGMHPSLTLHMAHRWNGILVALFVFALLWILETGIHRSLAAIAAILVLVQIVLGIASVTTGLGVISVTAHLGVAALLLAVLVSLWEVPA